MISLFKINDPYRLVLVFFLLILFRLPFLLNSSPVSIPELEWLVLGEKLASGAKLYTDVYHPTGPLAAGIYWIFSEIFGRSPIPLRVAGILLVFLEASFLSLILINHRAYNLNTYLPSLVFIILLSFFPESALLSPQLISMFFLLMAFNLIFSHIESRIKSDWVVLYSGFYTGLAGLAYLPSSLFILSIVATLILFTNTVGRRYFLLVYGFITPYILTWLYFFWKGDADMLMTNFFMSFAYKSTNLTSNYFALLVLISGPVIFMVFSIFLIMTKSNLISLQVILQNFMFIVLVTGLAVLSLDYHFTPLCLVVLFIPMSFYLSQLFVIIERRWLAESLFFALLVLTLGNGYLSYFGIFSVDERLSAEKYIPAETGFETIANGKKVLYIGDRTEVYLNARLATPYFNWAISKKYLQHADDPEILAEVTRQIIADPPDMIIDGENLITGFFSRSPLLEAKYRVGGEGIYYLR